MHSEAITKNLPNIPHIKALGRPKYNNLVQCGILSINGLTLREKTSVSRKGKQINQHGGQKCASIPHKIS